MAALLVRVRGLAKEYRAAGLAPVCLFRDLSFDVARGEMLAIVGQSGAGKSTLLHLIAGLDAPTAGEIVVNETDVAKLSADGRAAFRNGQIGYVWQAHYLLPEFTAAENVAMPLLARGAPRGTSLATAVRWLGEVGLRDRADHRAGELSGGEQQRVSLARALAGEPKLLLADEPTGNLDAATGEAVFALLRRIHRDFGTTTLLVTHNAAFAGRCDRVLRLAQGGVAAMSVPSNPLSF